ncbi:UPF0340 protein YwlG [Polycladomyces abyssicola]|jgi:uncharacterized protein (TIGR01440 family)|uniref:UPF0340 protein JIR001_30530 n=1 Tax=Polycladomyces abyssicola TaxID=1125966 RepID=A0A8D5UHB9_9BACL|nr:TIGR01440 family protein [Polycladomyces abyssicola]BCU83270.1 UPF0340 protein YwlG [Polycladomyces abyssicola]
MNEAKPDLFTPGQVVQLVDELVAEKPLDERHLLVVGVSTSEVIGKRIGTAGNDEVARAIFQELMEAQKKYGFHLAFQCCEHLNRALVVRRETMERFQLEEVTVVPVPKAGGAMAAYAYRHLDEAVIVESLRADAGIDIGDTLIGMHLKPVAVPVRPSCRQIGEAHVTMAKTRPKLIGGARAVYTLQP